MSEWQPIKSAPTDGRSVLLLSAAYEIEGQNGIIDVPARVAIGHWWYEGTSWVDDLGRMDGLGVKVNHLARTGVWLSGGGWFQPNEITHWMKLPDPPKESTEV